MISTIKNYVMIKLLSLVIVFVFSMNTIVWAIPEGVTLSTQSLFNSMLGKKQRRDIGIINYYLLCLAKVYMLNKIGGDVAAKLENKGLDIKLEFAMKESPEFAHLVDDNTNEFIVPCKISSERYYAYITMPESIGVQKDIFPVITVFTDEEYKACSKTGKIAHKERAPDTEKDIAHERDYDTPLSIVHGDSSLISDTDPEVETLILKFLMDAGAGNEFINEVKNFLSGGKVTLVPEESRLRLSLAGHEIELPVRIRPHASNNYINVPANADINSVAQVIVHELSAKCGNPHDFNEKLDRCFKEWAGSDARPRVLEKHMMFLSAVKNMRFVDLNQVVDRDLSAQKGLGRGTASGVKDTRRIYDLISRNLTFVAFLSAFLTSSLASLMCVSFFPGISIAWPLILGTISWVIVPAFLLRITRSLEPVIMDEFVAHPEREDNIKKLKGLFYLSGAELEKAYDTMVSDVYRRIIGQKFPEGFTFTMYFLDDEVKIGPATSGHQLLKCVQRCYLKVDINDDSISVKKNGQEVISADIDHINKGDGRIMVINKDGTCNTATDFINKTAGIELVTPLEDFIALAETGGMLVQNRGGSVTAYYGDLNSSCIISDNKDLMLYAGDATQSLRPRFSRTVMRRYGTLVMGYHMHMLDESLSEADKKAINACCRRFKRSIPEIVWIKRAGNKMCGYLYYPKPEERGIKPPLLLETMGKFGSAVISVMISSAAFLLGGGIHLALSGLFGLDPTGIFDTAVHFGLGSFLLTAVFVAIQMDKYPGPEYVAYKELELPVSVLTGPPLSGQKNYDKKPSALRTNGETEKYAVKKRKERERAFPETRHDKEVKAVRDLLSALFNLKLTSRNDAKILLALDKELGSFYTKQYVRKIIKHIKNNIKDKRYKEILDDLIVVDGTGQALADEVSVYVSGAEAVKSKVDPSNVIIITKDSNADKFNYLDGQAVITAVNDSNIGVMSYYPFVEIVFFTIAKALRLKGVPAFDRDRLKSLLAALEIEGNSDEGFIRECLDQRVITIKLEPSVPVDYEELDKLIDREFESAA